MGVGKFGFNLTEQESRQLMRHFDSNGDGQIHYNEFCDVILDSDCSAEMLRRQAGGQPLNTPTDLEYDKVVDKRAEDLKEEDAMRLAVRNIQRVFHQQTRLVTKLMKEFVRITPKKFVTSEQIKDTISNIGHEFSLADIERCVTFLIPNADMTQIDYVKFVQGMSVTHYNQPAAGR
eukprot:GHVS01021866.1.p1 GENE.GHVS01021866.1~~GHVS01021866.1.p1  ORF type:complete len:176 (-),score=24.71 GHVS01021866.1:475-1002(-)